MEGYDCHGLRERVCDCRIGFLSFVCGLDDGGRGACNSLVGV